MNNDRELLEAAARAAGYAFKWGTDWHDKGTPLVDGRDWYPLDDDGDALRLAVKLRLNITFTQELGRGHKNEFMQVSPKTMGHLAEFGPLGSDPSETIRRAIVRAAASLEQGAEK